MVLSASDGATKLCNEKGDPVNVIETNCEADVIKNSREPPSSYLPWKNVRFAASLSFSSGVPIESIETNNSSKLTDLFFT
jgi:hypothetical protein